MSTDQSPESTVAHPRMAAGALFFDAAGRVLMLEPSYKSHWEIPGGYVETGESPRQACIREVREELGITPRIGGLLAVDWAPSDAEGDKVLYVFDGGQLTDEQLAGVQLQAEELVSLTFLDLSEVERATIPRLARRVRAAAEARGGRGPVYLEHGQAVV